MSLFDDVTKMAGMAGLTGGAAGGGQAALLQSVVQLLGSAGSGGGLANIVQGFQKSGLGDQVASWVSTGKNLPISGDQLVQGLGAGRVKQLAQSAGLPEKAAASVLAGLLPTVIDRLTPAGAVPEDGDLNQLLGSVTSMFSA
jgi:uncharacterized protein YidB (DUF937 family)